MGRQSRQSRNDRRHIDDQAGGVEWARETAAALQSLPDQEASALRLVYNHGLSSREAAGWLGVNTSEFHRVVARALQQLGLTIIANNTDDPPTLTRIALSA